MPGPCHFRQEGGGALCKADLAAAESSTEWPPVTCEECQQRRHEEYGQAFLRLYWTPLGETLAEIIAEAKFEWPVLTELAERFNKALWDGWREFSGSRPN